MLINLSNHPSSFWDERQLAGAEELCGSVCDLPFPQVEPGAGLEEITALADKYFLWVQRLLQGKEREYNAVHLMGEFTFTFCLLELLREAGIPAYASTTARERKPDTQKFSFVQFRPYYTTTLTDKEAV